MATLTPDKNNLFINPYTFISKTSRVIREESSKGDLSGVIDCRLIVKGELALPDHSSGSDRRFDFYKVDGKPVVPGSEIRGCVRSVFEAITPSCFSVMNSNVLTKRLSRPDNNVAPGILRFEGDRWYIYESLKYKPSAWKGGKVTLTRSWPAFKGGKLTNSYFIQNGTNPIYECSDEEIDSFAELLDIFKAYAKTNNRHLFSELLNKLKNEEDIAVFYRFDSNDELDYLSPAQVSRYIFSNTVSSLLGEHAVGLCGKPVKNEKGDEIKKYCPACSLFGTLGAGNPLASRLRFFDATAENVILSKDFKNLPELSSPKITSVEFYSKTGSEYTDTNSWDYDSAAVELNGRKFYFHSDPKAETVLGERSIASKTALAGSVFSFKIAFDRIDRKQLRQLLWVLTIGDNNEDSVFCHKLGVGKPVGYGSVKLIVDGVATRSFKDGFYMVEHMDYESFDVSEDLFDEKKALWEFKQIANRKYLEGKNVTYPIADDGTGSKNARAAHQWFSSNRTQGNRQRAAQFRYVLHPISENAGDLELPAMIAGGGSEGAYGENSGGARQGHASPGSAVTGLEIGKTYDAILLREVTDKHGITFYVISINDVSRAGRFDFRVNKRNVRGKRIGDTIKVKYNGANDSGAPKFWVV